MNLRVVGGLLSFLILITFRQVGAAPYTYQGRIFDGVSPAGGSVGMAFDLTFKLYTDAAATNQVGSTVTRTNVAIIDGYFDAELDFGAGAGPTADARWLKVSVARSSTPTAVQSFVQKIRYVPQAEYAALAGAAATAQGLRLNATTATALEATSAKAVKLGNAILNNDNASYLRYLWNGTEDTGGVHLGHSLAGKNVRVHFGATDAKFGFDQRDGVNKNMFNFIGGPVRFNTSEPSTANSGGVIAVQEMPASPDFFPGVTETALRGVAFSFNANLRTNATSPVTALDLLDEDRPGWYFTLRSDMYRTGSATTLGDADGDLWGLVRVVKPSGGSMHFSPMMTVNRRGALVMYPHIDPATGTFDSAATPPVPLTGTAILYVGANSSFTESNPPTQAELDANLNNIGELYVRDTSTNTTRLSSHATPRSSGHVVTTSFEDPEVRLPFSFNHSNQILGVGCTVDMAKLVKWAEAKMQTEIGHEEGKLSYYFDLPASEKISIDAVIEKRVEDAISEDLRRQPYVEVALGPNGLLPDDAWEEVDITQEVEVEEQVIEAEIDWSRNAVVKRPVTRKVLKHVPTGQREKHLRPDYALNGDKLVRTRTVDDVNISAENIAPLPDWILQRAGESLTHEQMEAKVQAKITEARDRMRNATAQVQNLNAPSMVAAAGSVGQ